MGATKIRSTGLRFGDREDGPELVGADAARVGIQWREGRSFAKRSHGAGAEIRILGLDELPNISALTKLLTNPRK